MQYLYLPIHTIRLTCYTMHCYLSLKRTSLWRSALHPGHQHLHPIYYYYSLYWPSLYLWHQGLHRFVCLENMLAFLYVYILIVIWICRIVYKTYDICAYICTYVCVYVCSICQYSKLILNTNTSSILMHIRLYMYACYMRRCPRSKSSFINGSRPKSLAVSGHMPTLTYTTGIRKICLYEVYSGYALYMYGYGYV